MVNLLEIKTGILYSDDGNQSIINVFDMSKISRMQQPRISNVKSDNVAENTTQSRYVSFELTCGGIEYDYGHIYANTDATELYNGFCDAYSKWLKYCANGNLDDIEYDILLDQLQKVMQKKNHSYIEEVRPILQKMQALENKKQRN